MAELHQHIHSEQSAQAASSVEPVQIPAFLQRSENYTPPADRDAFIRRSTLSIASVLRQFRLDDGASSPFSPSAPCKTLLALGVVLLNSLSSNFAFTLVLLALVLLRACLLPAKQLARACAVAAPAALLAFLLMLPAVLLGQPQSAVRIAVKTFVSVLLVMEVALTTPYSQLTAGLRAFHVPSVVILTIDLALKNIVNLGEVALEVLTSLRLRSVGRNARKRESMGGATGVVFLKANKAAQDTFDAMQCRGFDGSYRGGSTHLWCLRDLVWLVLFAALVALFIYLQGVVL